MLSFERGRPIAVIRGGKYNDKIIHIFDPDTKCCKKCNDKCGIKNKYCCTKCIDHKGINKEDMLPDIKYEDIYDVIDEDFIRSHKKKLSIIEMSKLKKAIYRKTTPLEDDLAEIYKSVQKKMNDTSKNEFIIK